MDNAPGLKDFLSRLNAGDKEALAQATAAKSGPKRAYKPKAPKTGGEASDLRSKLQGHAGGVHGLNQAQQGGAQNARAVHSARIAARAATPALAAGGAGAAAASAAPAAAQQAPLASRVKAVLDVLHANRGMHTLEQLSVKANLDIAADEELRGELTHHPNVEIVADQYRYRPKLMGIKNRQDLLRYLRQLTTVEGAGEKGLVGVKVGAVDDAYLGIADDIKTLQRDNMIFKFDHTHNAAEAVLFYNEQDPSLGLKIKPRIDLVNLFHNTAIPEHARDLEAAMAAVGQRSLMAHRPRLEKLAPEARDKKRRRRDRAINVAKATNAHLPELFMGGGHTEIDVRH